MWSSGQEVLLLLLLLLLAGSEGYMKMPPDGKNSPPEMWMTTPQLIQARGYTAESHEVRTEDGYVLVMHRILLPRNGTLKDLKDPKNLKALKDVEPHRTPLMVGHGLLSCDEQWVLREEDNLVFLLVDSGYDVWLGNYRGSFYSRRHATLTPRMRKFWDFSWHENGVYDDTAMMDYILNATKKDSLIILGHSMSSTTNLVMLAERPDHGRRVRASFLLSPPVYFKHSTNFIFLSELFLRVPWVYDAYSNRVINDVALNFDKPSPQNCFKISSKKTVIFPLCKFFFIYSLGTFRSRYPWDLMRKIMGHFPAGASIRQLFHYAQITNAGGRFVKYDFGAAKNMKVYGSRYPPQYDFRKITTPVYIYGGLRDDMVHHTDVERLARDIPSLKELTLIPEYNHVDLVIAPDAYETAYKKLFRQLSLYV